MNGNTIIRVNVSSIISSQLEVNYFPSSFNAAASHTYCHAIATSIDNQNEPFGYVDLIINEDDIFGTIITEDHTFGIYPVLGDPFIHLVTIVNNQDND